MRTMRTAVVAMLLAGSVPFTPVSAGPADVVGPIRARRPVLVPGGSKDAADLVKDFLGRRGGSSWRTASTSSGRRESLATLLGTRSFLTVELDPISALFHSVLP